ncbi:MAG: YrzE family protein [candidate division WOR-3 bacterium]|nr:YrzE family protein [candidate division WOR-3 bacterium]
MRRKIIAVTVGFLVSLGMLFIINILYHPGRYPVIVPVIAHSLFALVGGFTAGYLIGRRGLIYGLLVAIMLETLGIANHFRVTPISIHTLTGIVPTPLFVFAWHNYVWGPYHFVVFFWKNMYGFPIVALISGAAGGHLGQLLAQKWHKRSQKKSDASKSETR